MSTTQVVTSVAVYPRKRPFHVALQEERKQRQLSVRRLAKFAGVSEDQYRRWESGDGMPSLLQLQKMHGQSNVLCVLRELAHATASNDAVSAKVDSEPISGLQSVDKTATVEPDVETNVEGEKAVAPATFGAALYTSRIAACVSAAALGRFIGVHAATITNWEKGTGALVPAVYEALITRFPALKTAPKPKLCVGSKPGRKPATFVVASPTKATLEPSKAEPPIDSLAALDLVVEAYEQIGIRITPFFERSETLRTIRLVNANQEVVVEGAGTTMVDAAQRVLRSVRSSLVNQTTKARAELDLARQRLEAQEAAVISVDAILEKMSL
jgi:DNA-binding XRE family transcriptional regulator